MNKNKKMTKEKLFLIILSVASLTLLINTVISKVNLSRSDLVPAVIAKQNIAAGLVISEDMIVITEIPTQDILEGAIIDPVEVIGKTATVPLYAKEQIIPNKITTTIQSPSHKNWTLAIHPLDKALDLKKHTFIDIWLTPTGKGFEKSLEPTPLFQGVKIAGLKNESFLTQEELPKTAENTNPIFVPEYAVFNLSEAQVKKLSNINPAIYTIRFALHNEALLYSNLTADAPLEIEIEAPAKEDGEKELEESDEIIAAEEKNEEDKIEDKIEATEKENKIESD